MPRRHRLLLHLLVFVPVAPLLAQDPATCPLHGTPGHGEEPVAAAEPPAPADHRSPYLELQGRAIKALGDDEIRQLLAGEGMGLALPAELNGYPGPKHVLELSAELGLDASQRQAVQESFDRMHQRAVQLGHSIVDGERTLDGLWAAGSIDREALALSTADLARLRGELRAAHLQAHLETRAELSGEQIARYAELRGYGAVHRH